MAVHPSMPDELARSLWRGERGVRLEVRRPNPTFAYLIARVAEATDHHGNPLGYTKLYVVVPVGGVREAYRACSQHDLEAKRVLGIMAYFGL